MACSDRVLRLPEVLALVGVKKSTIYAWVKAKRFPPPIELGKRAVGWLCSTVLTWIANREPK
jgi:prophage regulatory protein